MTLIKDIIQDYSPPEGSTGVALSSSIIVLFDRLMDEDSLSENFFVSGPDTDQFIGPGLAEFNIYPDNVSQGDDFLTSPGLPGIVDGTFSFETVSGATQMTFTPSRQMSALIVYTAHLPTVDDVLANTYTGVVTFSWTTGTGSIEALPDTSSTSVLTNIVSSVSALEALEVVSTTPAVYAIEQDTDLVQIEIEFNKAIASNSVNSTNVKVKAYSASGHPSLGATVNETIAAKLTAAGKKIIIEI